MKNITFKEFPKCPKCKKGCLLPLSEPREGYGVKDYCLIYAKWKCSNCKPEVIHDE